MLKFIKDIEEIKEKLSLTPEVPTVGDLTRHQLGSIDLTDFESLLPQNEEERKAYVRYIASGFKPHLSPVGKKLIQAQLEFLGKEAIDWEKSLFAKGTLNGIMLLYEEFEKCFGEHIQDIIDANKSNFNPHDTINTE